MHSFFIKVDGKYQRVKFSDIIYVEGFKNYVRIHTSLQKILTHNTLREIEEYLPKDLFFKIHKSYIIAVEKLTSFDRESVFLGSVQLPISIHCYDQLKNKVNVVQADKKVKKSQGIKVNGSSILEE
jgi:DNA-binding LytR/AlgR family response regulator